MATYESLSSASSDNTGSLTITKPTGLAVGDRMVAGILVDRDAGATASVSTPSGWTQEALLDLESLGRNALAVYSKTATSGDVAASDFTFAGSGSTASMTMTGILLRVSNWGGSAGLTSNTSVAASTTMTMTGVTPSPAVASSLYLVFAGRISSSPLSVSVSSVAIATSNPTWTERAEVSGNGNTYDTTLAAYTATRTETTATGTYTVTYNNTTNLGSGAVAIILHTPINGSISVSDQKVAAYAYSPITDGTVDAIATDPTLTESNPAIWTNEATATTTWTNETL